MVGDRATSVAAVVPPDGLREACLTLIRPRLSTARTAPFAGAGGSVPRETATACAASRALT